MPVDPLSALRAVLISRENPDLHPEMDLERYKATRDPDLIKPADARQPAIFSLKPLRASFVINVLQDITGAAERTAMAFRASCHEVQIAGGETLKPKRFTQGRYGTQIADDSWIDEIAARWGLSGVVEMGSVAMIRASVARDAEAPFA